MAIFFNNYALQGLLRVFARFTYAVIFIFSAVGAG